MTNTSRRLLATFTALALFGCSSDTITNSLPVVVSLSPQAVSVPVGGTAQFTAGATQGGSTVAQQFTYSVDNAAVATVTSSGLVTGVSAGTAKLTAKVASGEAATATITVTPAVPAVIEKTAGDAQTAPSGQPVAIAPSVTVKDAFGKPVAGTTVTFAVASGGGLITGPTQVTGANGVATVGAWRVSALGANTLTATVAGIAPVTFTATATAALGTIGLTPTAVTFSAAVGGSTPPAQTVSVAAVGGVVGNLSIGTISYIGGPTGWLTATLNGAAAPATVTLTPNITGLTAGTYTTLVPVNSSASGVAGQQITVTINVAATRVFSLVVRRQPGGTASAALLSPQPVVEFHDQGGGLATDVTDAVTVALDSAGGSLVGVTTINAVGGVATFTSLSVLGGGSFTLTFTSPNATPVTSNLFSVAGNSTGQIGLNIGTGVPDTVALGNTVDIPVIVDMSSSTRSLAGISFNFTWDPAVFDFVLGSNGKFGSGSFVVNTSNVQNGSLTVTASDANGGLTTGVTTIYTVRLLTKLNTSGTSVTATLNSARDAANAAIAPSQILIRPVQVVVP